MIKIIRVCLLFLVLILFFFQEMESRDTHIPLAMDYEIELVKFYLDKQEYELALSKSDEILQKGIQSDSLFILRGRAYAGLAGYEEAAAEYSILMQISSEEDLMITALNEYKTVLKQLNAFQSIESISSTLNEVENILIRNALLYLLADIYEQNQLFDEANDVYGAILKDESEPAYRVELQLKIAANDIYLKNYREAVSYLEPIIALQDSIYDQKALFFNYIAHYSLNNYREAKESLLKLFLDYPDHLNRFEIIRGLADLYYIEKQYLMSWYFLDLLFKIGDNAQKFSIYNEIEEIKKLLSRDSVAVDQFKYFEPVFDFPER